MEPGTHAESPMFSLLGLVILVLDIWAIVQIVSGKDDNVKKLLWVLLILLLPLLGLLLWYVLARK
jgi:hypothetical protein